MTVKEAIEQLKKLPPNAVMVKTPDGAHWWEEAVEFKLYVGTNKFMNTKTHFMYCSNPEVDDCAKTLVEIL